MVRRPPGCLRIDPAEPKLPKIEPANKDIDRTNRIIFVNPIFQAFREQRALPRSTPSTKRLISFSRESDHENRTARRFHTARVMNGPHSTQRANFFTPEIITFGVIFGLD